MGSETDHTIQGSSMGKESLKTSGCKNLWGLWQGRNSQPPSRVKRDPQGPKTYTNLPTRESAVEGPNLLVGSGGSD